MSGNFPQGSTFNFVLPLSAMNNGLRFKKYSHEFFKN
ncbi:MAG: hypothetical protein JWQ27_1488 [Ferruginibacter sp.]|nr:hypothetical protein [Ferruginibacter sp.]